ncbi:hypothetical protein NL676_028409 [Syzygium grande]|nr:hypothetical protein NL676_028409 [Syzygium grande]
MKRKTRQGRIGLDWVGLSESSPSPAHHHVHKPIPVKRDLNGSKKTQLQQHMEARSCPKSSLISRLVFQFRCSSFAAERTTSGGQRVGRLLKLWSQRHYEVEDNASQRMTGDWRHIVRMISQDDPLGNERQT